MRERLTDRELQRISDALVASDAALDELNREILHDVRFDLGNSMTSYYIGIDAGVDVEEAQNLLKKVRFKLGEARKRIESLRRIDDGDDAELRRYRKKFPR